MIAELKKVANYLESQGLYEAANSVDDVIVKIAAVLSDAGRWVQYLAGKGITAYDMMAGPYRAKPEEIKKKLLEAIDEKIAAGSEQDKGYKLTVEGTEPEILRKLLVGFGVKDLREYLQAV